jgi:hypothetical protein
MSFIERGASYCRGTFQSLADAFVAALVERDGRQIRLLLAKNPAGWLEAFDMLDEPPVPVLLSVSIGILGSFLAIVMAGLTLDLYAQIGMIVLIGLALAAKGASAAAGGRTGVMRVSRAAVRS